MLRTVHLSFPRPGSHGAHRKSVIASPCPSQPSFGAAGLARESEICNYGNKVVLVRGVLSTSDLRFLIIWSGSQASTSGDIIKLVDYGSRGKSLGTQAQSVQDACRSVRMVVLSLQPSIHPSIHPFLICSHPRMVRGSPKVKSKARIPGHSVYSSSPYLTIRKVMMLPPNQESKGQLR